MGEIFFSPPFNIKGVYAAAAAASVATTTVLLLLHLFAKRSYFSSSLSRNVETFKILR